MHVVSRDVKISNSFCPFNLFQRIIKRILQSVLERIPRLVNLTLEVGQCSFSLILLGKCDFRDCDSITIIWHIKFLLLSRHKIWVDHWCDHFRNLLSFLRRLRSKRCVESLVFGRLWMLLNSFCFYQTSWLWRKREPILLAYSIQNSRL